MGRCVVEMHDRNLQLWPIAGVHASLFRQALDGVQRQKHKRPSPERGQPNPPEFSPRRCGHHRFHEGRLVPHGSRATLLAQPLDSPRPVLGQALQRRARSLVATKFGDKVPRGHVADGHHWRRPSLAIHFQTQGPPCGKAVRCNRHGPFDNPQGATLCGNLCGPNRLEAGLHIREDLSSILAPRWFEGLGPQILGGSQRQMTFKSTGPAGGKGQVTALPSGENLILFRIQSVQRHGDGPFALARAVRHEQIEVGRIRGPVGRHHGHRTGRVDADVLNRPKLVPSRSLERDQVLWHEVPAQPRSRPQCPRAMKGLLPWQVAVRPAHVKPI